MSCQVSIHSSFLHKTLHALLTVLAPFGPSLSVVLEGPHLGVDRKGLVGPLPYGCAGCCSSKRCVSSMRRGAGVQCCRTGSNAEWHFRVRSGSSAAWRFRVIFTVKAA